MERRKTVTRSIPFARRLCVSLRIFAYREAVQLAGLRSPPPPPPPSLPVRLRRLRRRLPPCTTRSDPPGSRRGSGCRGRLRGRGGGEGEAARSRRRSSPRCSGRTPGTGCWRDRVCHGSSRCCSQPSPAAPSFTTPCPRIASQASLWATWPRT